MRCENGPLFNKTAFKRDLIWLSQLFPEGKQISYPEAKANFNLNFLELLGIISAIPHQWKEELLQSHTTSPAANVTDTLCDQYINSKHLTAKVYKELIADDCALDNKCTTWQAVLGANHDTVRKSFSQLYAISNIPKAAQLSIPPFA